MNSLLQLFRVLWKAYFLAISLISLALLYPIFYILLSNKKWFPVAFSLKKIWGWTLRFLSGMWMVYKKKSPFPEPPYIVCSNHSSYLDIIMMHAAMEDYTVFMGKAEIAKWPLVNIFFKKNMDIAVDRGSRIAGARSLELAGKEIDKGNCVVIFPEGTIPADAPKLKKFKNGAFKLAIEKQVPIVPISFPDTWKRLQSGAVLKAMGGAGQVRTYIHEPVSTEGMTEKDLVILRDRIFDIINEPLQDAGR